MNEENKKLSKKNINKYIILIVLLALFLIGIGIYFSYISNPIYIYKSIIDTISTETKSILITNDSNNLKDYTLTSNIKWKINNSNSQNIELNNLLSKLNNLDTNVIVKQDLTNQKILYELNSKLNNEALFEGKYLIQDATGYYFIKDYLTTYVNTGNNNYFETLNNSTTMKENISYLYDCVTQYTTESLKKEYFKESKEEVSTINGTKKLIKMSLELDNDKVIELLNNIISKLKQDEKANKLLSSMFEDFSNYKIKNDQVIISSDETFEFNIYTSSIQYKPVKFEFLINAKDSEFYEKKITYEQDKDTGVIYFIENNKVINILNVKKNNSNDYDIEIFDNKNTNLGNIEFNKTKTNTNMSIYTTSKEQRFEFRYTSKKESENNINTNIILKLIDKEVNLVDFEINISSNISNDVSITEDTSNAILENSITDLEEEKLDNIILNIIYKLLM